MNTKNIQITIHRATTTMHGNFYNLPKLYITNYTWQY